LTKTISIILCSYLLPFALLLNGYSSGIPGVSLGSLTIGILIVICFTSSITERGGIRLPRINAGLVFLFFNLYLITLFNVIRIQKFDLSDSLISIIKLLIWLLSIIIICSQYLNKYTFVRNYLSLSFISTIYIYIQYISWEVLNVFLPNLFLFGPLRPLYDDYGAEAYYEYISSIGVMRPAGFFSEPAFYGNIIVIAIALLLYNASIGSCFQKHRIVLICFFVGGVIISTSSAGVALVIILYMVYFLQNRMRRKDYLSVLIIIVISSVLWYLIINGISIASQALSLSLEKLTDLGNRSRVGRSFSVLKSMSTLDLCLGVGAGNTFLVSDIYMNSITSLIVSYGIIGLLIFFVVGIYMYIKCNSDISRVLLILYMAKNFQSGAMFNIFGIFFVGIAILFVDYLKENKTVLI